jgi:hypothetical protein
MLLEPASVLGGVDMRRTAFTVTCMVLVAALLFPGVACAKGGNGRHADPAKSDLRKAKAPKSDAAKADKPKADTAKPKPAKNDSGKADKPNADRAKPKSPKVGAGKADEPKADAGKLPAQTTSPKAAPQRDATSDGGQRSARELATAGSAAKPVPAVDARQSGSVPAIGLDAAVPSPSAHPAYADVPSGSSSTETRGVLDTIRIEASAAIESVGNGLRQAWSTIASWLAG